MRQIYRIHVRQAFCALLLCLLPSVYADGIRVQYEPLEAHPLEQELFKQSNETRESFGVSALEYDAQLTLAARHHAAEMAKLHYLSHTSPVSETSTLYHRVVRAGSLALRVNENLAQIANRGEVLERAIQGWLDSPGHRRNFLDSEYTHMGVALAEDDQNYVYFVQVFAYQPIVLRGYDLEVETNRAYDMTVQFEVVQASEVSFFYGNVNTIPRVYQVGQYQENFVVAREALWQVRMGARDVASTVSFMLQDEGWVNAEERSFTPSHTVSRQRSSIVDIDVAEVEQEMIVVSLEFAEPLPESAVIFLDEQAIRDVDIQERRATIRIPRSALGSVLDIGLAQGNHRYDVVMQMQVRMVGGQLRLSSIEP